jgi:hypothetical protein
VRACAAVFVCALALVASGSAAPHARSVDAVLYSIGVTTDPYGKSTPRGFGVLSGILSGRFERSEVRRREYGGFPGASWLEPGRVLVARHAPPLRNPAIFRYRRGRLEHVGFAPFPGGSTYFRSPEGRRIAFAPPRPCHRHQRSLFSCYRAGTRIFVVSRGEKHRVATGLLGGWTHDGRLVTYATTKAWTRGDATVLDLATGGRRLRRRYWPDQQPIRSADGRYFATLRGINERTRVTILRADGHVVQQVTTRYIVSMLAWSTRGHLLAYTTSGFPAPHQLFVIDPGHPQRKIFATGAKHFDWITWSPDGRFILLDGEEYGGWHLFSVRTGREVATFPRLGGRPEWCCPVNTYRRNA